jgi:hypothetical protein
MRSGTPTLRRASFQAGLRLGRHLPRNARRHAGAGRPVCLLNYSEGRGTGMYMTPVLP